MFTWYYLQQQEIVDEKVFYMSQLDSLDPYFKLGNSKHEDHSMWRFFVLLLCHERLYQIIMGHMRVSVCFL